MLLEKGRRSSIVKEGDTLLRVYHDTGRTTMLPLNIDGAGVVRMSGNRRVDSLEKNVFRGSAKEGSQKPTPAHLQRTIRLMILHVPPDIETVATLLNVKTSTAWCYLCKAVEEFPSFNTYAACVVYEPLLRALCEVSMSGSLTEVMQRVNQGPLKGCTEWRCTTDRFAHLRLARLCLMPD